jgi:hypothetical protein
VRSEAYDLCLGDEVRFDGPGRALVEAVQSRPYRRLLADLPGYDTAQTGAVQRINLEQLPVSKFPVPS